MRPVEELTKIVRPCRGLPSLEEALRCAHTSGVLAEPATWATGKNHVVVDCKLQAPVQPVTILVEIGDRSK